MDTRRLVAVIAAALAGIGAAITGVVMHRKKRIY